MNNGITPSFVNHINHIYGSFFFFEGWEEPSFNHQHLAADGKLRQWQSSAVGLPALPSQRPVLEMQGKQRAPEKSQGSPPSLHTCQCKWNRTSALGCFSLHPAGLDACLYFTIGWFGDILKALHARQIIRLRSALSVTCTNWSPGLRGTWLPPHAPGCTYWNPKGLPKPEASTLSAPVAPAKVLKCYIPFMDF